jgi:hypothetical protein
MTGTNLFDDLLELMVKIAMHEDCLVKREIEINRVIRHLKTIAFDQLNKNNRIYLMDTAIKFGNLALVQAIFALFEKYELLSELRLPSVECSTPFRPSFWLASIVSPYPLVLRQAYQAIENFLCEKLNIGERVNIAGMLLTKAEYLTRIATWRRHFQQESIYAEKYSVPVSLKEHFV